MTRCSRREAQACTGTAFVDTKAVCRRVGYPVAGSVLSDERQRRGRGAGAAARAGLLGASLLHVTPNEAQAAVALILQR